MSRYIHVCRGSEVNLLLSRKRHRILCFSSTAFAILGSVLTNMGIMLRNLRRNYFVTRYFVSGAFVAVIIMYYIAPALVCLILYSKIIMKLKAMLSNAEQNSRLNKSLVASWAVWSIFRLPSTMVTMVRLYYLLGDHRIPSLYRSNKTLISNLSITMNQLCSLLVPLIFLLVSPTFQRPLRDMMKIFIPIKNRPTP